MQLYGLSKIGGGDMGTAYVLNISDIQTIWKTMLLFCALQITANPSFPGLTLVSFTLHHGPIAGEP